MSKPTPKFPHNLAVVDRVDSSSAGADRDKQFPIMSISKSCCGAVSTLMAVDGKFGDKKLDATLEEVLTVAAKAHSNNPARLQPRSVIRKKFPHKTTSREGSKIEL